VLVRTARITVVIAWVLVLGVVAYLATHTRVTAPFLSRLVSRHFLQQVDGRLRLGDYRLRPLHGVDLYGVAITLRTRGGGLTVINVDTLEIDFKLTEVIGRAKRLRRLELIDTSVYMLVGAQETERPSRDWSQLRFPAVRADQVIVTGAELEVSGPDGALRERISRLDWHGKVVAADSLWVLTRDGAVAWDTHQSRLTALSGEVVVDGRSVRSPRLRGRFNDHAVTVGGRRRWDGHIELSVEVDSVSIEEISNLIGIGIGVSAAGAAAGDIVVAEDGVHLDLGFTGELEGYDLEGATVHGDLDPGASRSGSRRDQRDALRRPGVVRDRRSQCAGLRSRGGGRRCRCFARTRARGYGAAGHRRPGPRDCPSRGARRCDPGYRRSTGRIRRRVTVRHLPP